MTKSVVGVYDRLETARSVVSDLVDAGFDRDMLNIVANDPDGSYAGYIDTDGAGDGAATGAGVGATIGGIGGLLVGLGALAIPGVGPVIAAGPILAALTGAGIGAVTGGLIGALVDLGIPEEDAHLYSEGLRRGNILVVAQVPDNRVNEASRIMQRSGLLDIHQQADTWRSEGWEGYPATASTANATRNMNVRQDRMDTTRSGSRTTDGTATRSKDGEETFEVVQEEVKIGKRAVEGGGVRVHSYVREVPVEEEVRLREEHVNVERRPVNRPARAGDLESFKEGSIEMTERSEEAVISKDARVVEEVVVSKDVNERTETVRDTVRRTEVEVERMGNGNARTDFNKFDNDFRTHFQNTYGSRGMAYDRFQPAYRYGYDLSSDQRFQGRQWNEIERDVRRDWESRNQGPWEDFKDAVRYGWNRITR
jgi:uncharacterized protein (TIGR02271 family)